MDHIPISSILIDERVRKEMGDIPALARSISEVGMLQPVLVGESRRLVAGVRRILAAKSLGWEQVPAFIVGNFKDAIHKLKAERDENTCRKAFTPSELGEVAAQLLAMEKPAAKERQAAVGGKSPGKSACGTVPQAPEGKSRDKVGEALGVSGKTAEKAAAVVTAAKEDPESFGDLPAQMDANGVAPAHKELKKRKAKKSGSVETADVLTDELDVPIPPGLAGVFKKAAEFKEVVNQLNAINRKLAELKESPAGACLRLQAAQIDLKNLKETVRFDTPYCVCPVCSGNAKTRKQNCPCKQRGWLIEGAYKNLPSEYRT